jgi:uncharacterized OB-fold protein
MNSIQARSCENCGELFTPLRRHAKLCSRKCRSRMWLNRSQEHRREYQRQLPPELKRAYVAKWRANNPEKDKAMRLRAKEAAKRRHLEARIARAIVRHCSCGRPFNATAGRHNRSNIECHRCRARSRVWWQGYWSKIERSKRPKRIAVCVQCGSQFTPLTSRVNACSNECRVKRHGQSPSKQRQNERKREKTAAALKKLRATTRACKYCGQDFHPDFHVQLFCSARCKQTNGCRDFLKRAKENLSDYYLKRLLKRRSSLSARDFPPQVVELKRMEQLAKREINKR